MSIVNATFEITYKTRFLLALLAVLTIPTAVALMNFDLFDNSVYQLTFTFSLLSIMSGSHAYLNLAYYGNSKWREHFNRRPVVFYLAPLTIFLGSLVLIAQPLTGLGLSMLYATTFLNLWHHSKQNWGILAIVGRVRGKDVSALRTPLIYAWPFFIIPWALQLPEVTAYLGESRLYWASIICIALFGCWCVVFAKKGGFFRNQDPIVLIAGVLLCVYFMPMILMRGKPYALFIWAGAHALQYYLMVFISLSMRNRPYVDLRILVRGAAVAIGMLFLLTLIGHLATDASAGPNLWTSLGSRLIFGAIVGVNLVHFWMDAFIWKFGEKPIRELHGGAFNF